MENWVLLFWDDNRGTAVFIAEKLQQRMAAISVTCPSPKWETGGDVTTFKQSLTQFKFTWSTRKMVEYGEEKEKDQRINGEIVHDWFDLWTVSPWVEGKQKEREMDRKQVEMVKIKVKQR